MTGEDALDLGKFYRLFVPHPSYTTRMYACSDFILMCFCSQLDNFR